MKKSNIMLIALVILLGTAGFFLPNALNTSADMDGILLIRVSGAVNNPGIIALSVNGTVREAIEKAGGMLPEADISEINLQKKLQKSQSLFVPSK